MYWIKSHRADPKACKLADRHYNRQSIGSPQFVPPGRCLVLVTPDYGALWVTSWPFAEFVKHKWAGRWVCSLFRRESGPLASDLIGDAVAATRWFYGDPPADGFLTFVNTLKIKQGTKPGYCFQMAGWDHIGWSKGGLKAFGLEPEKMPAAKEPLDQLL